MVNIICVIGIFWMYLHLHVYNYMYIVDEALSERSKDTIRGKCTQYLERAEQLKKYVQQNKGVHSSSGVTPAEFLSTLAASEVTSANSVRALVVVE